MGAFDKAKPVIIPDPEDAKASEAFRKKWGWEAHEQIIIRGQFTAADQEAMENASAALEGKGKHRMVKMQTGTARRTLLERMIVDWTLTEGGRPVEVNAANIGRLPSNYRKPVLEACDAIARVMDEDEQDDFLDGANGPTTDS